MNALAVIDIGLDPVLVRLGPLAVHWYGLAYVAAMIIGLWVAAPFAEEQGISREIFYEGFWPVLIAGLIGGRLYYVAQSDFGAYLRRPQDILATWEGGMAVYGAMAAAFATAYIVCRRRNVSFVRLLDVAAVFSISQAIGRLGNIVNGDIIGYPSSLPWAIRYTNPHNTFVSSHAISYQPANVYEFLFSVALFATMWWLRHRFRVPGTLFALYLLLYSAGQFVLFFDRANIVVAFGLKQAQLTALVTIAVVLIVWSTWRRKYLSKHGPHHSDSESDRKAAAFA